MKSKTIKKKAFKEGPAIFDRRHQLPCTSSLDHCGIYYYMGGPVSSASIPTYLFYLQYRMQEHSSKAAKLYDTPLEGHSNH